MLVDLKIEASIEDGMIKIYFEAVYSTIEPNYANPEVNKRKAILYIPPDFFDQRFFNELIKANGTYSLNAYDCYERRSSFNAVAFNIFKVLNSRCSELTGFFEKIHKDMKANV